MKQKYFVVMYQFDMDTLLVVSLLILGFPDHKAVPQALGLTFCFYEKIWNICFVSLLWNENRFWNFKLSSPVRSIPNVNIAVFLFCQEAEKLEVTEENEEHTEDNADAEVHDTEAPSEEQEVSFSFLFLSLTLDL